MIENCPGAKQFKRPEPQYIKCPFCSQDVEIWTDEVQATCDKCKNTVMRQGNGFVSCLDWCQYAKECIGEDKYEQYLKNKELLEKQRAKQKKTSKKEKKVI